MKKWDFNTMKEALEYAHKRSLVFDTDDECQEEEERILALLKIKERDE